MAKLKDRRDKCLITFAKSRLNRERAIVLLIDELVREKLVGGWS
jgi:hypothetical protein